MEGFDEEVTFFGRQVGGEPQQGVGGGVAGCEDLQGFVCSSLNVSEGRALPKVVDDAAMAVPTKKAGSISFKIKFKILRGRPEP